MTTQLTPDALQAILASHAAWLATGTGQPAKLTGANLAGADLFRADLAGANLARANLFETNLFEANLFEANLAGANLTRADLTRADLAGANLTRADLAGTRGLPPAPAIPRLDSASVDAITLDAHALNMDIWHTCATTHCRAGWAIVLAGAPGAALERQYGPAAAGALIYAASYPDRRVPNFYASTSDAWSELQASAAAEAHTQQGVEP